MSAVKYHKRFTTRHAPVQGRRQLEMTAVTANGCPVCERPITVGSRGRVRLHRNRRGEECPGSGTVVEGLDYSHVGPQPITLPERDQRRPGRRSTVQHIKSRKGAKLPHSAFCPECGRQTAVLGDGTFRKHRPVADAFVGPYCGASGSVAS